LAWCRRGWHPGDDPEDRDGRCPFNSTTAMVAFIVQDAYSRHMGYDTNRNWVEVTVDRPEEIERVHAALADVTVRRGCRRLGRRGRGTGAELSSLRSARLSACCRAGIVDEQARDEARHHGKGEYSADGERDGRGHCACARCEDAAHVGCRLRR
jgi:hypothetical protein